MQDQQIIELIRTNRHHKAFAALYRHYPAVKKLILSKGGRAGDAEDIYQEALIILCRKVNSSDFQLTAKLSTYLYSVSRFLWKDELKKRQKHSFVEMDDAGAADNGIEETVESESRYRLAEKVVAGLGERCRELLQYFYFEAMSMKTIASKMGFGSEKVAKNQKYKCIERAKAKLKELQADPA
jgi:RNA polymerase sigma factor (sigma-70 family)